MAAIMLNWSMVDMAAHYILINLYELNKHRTASDLIGPIGLSRKLDLIEKARKAGEIGLEGQELCDALKLANSSFLKNRNIVAHGVLTDPWDDQSRKLMSMTKFDFPSIDESQLEIVHRQSSYASQAATSLLKFLADKRPPSALPPKPPELSS